jgi:predicted AAA+ superfamily ATPase
VIYTRTIFKDIERHLETGLVNHFARLDEGHIFENSVFQNLRARGELNYYQRKSGVELDFILDQKEAYEVKINPGESDARRVRELSHELGLERYRIVSRKFSELEGVTYGFML